jgi:hypothetical protein
MDWDLRTGDMKKIIASLLLAGTLSTYDNVSSNEFME